MRRQVIVFSAFAALCGILAYGFFPSWPIAVPSGPLKDGEFVIAAFFS